MNENTINTKPAKQAFSAVGIAMSVFIAVVFILQMLWDIIPTFIWGENNWFVSSSLGMWLRSIIPIYLVGFPICILLMRRTPAETSVGVKMGAKNFFAILPINFFIMYLGGIIGTALSFILTNGEAQNPLESMLSDNSIFKFIVPIILAPLIEEFICRKLIIDRTKKYGEKNAILLSALIFGLMHGNFIQFFGTFGAGLLWGYVYVRTGRLRYSIIYHMIVNSMGTLASTLTSLVDIEAIATIDTTLPEPELIEAITPILPAILLFLLFFVVVVFLFITGLVLLIITCRKLTFKEAPAELPKGTRFKTIYLNVSIILFILLSIVAFVLALM